MAQITSSVGLISGINTQSVIDQLISLDSAPKTNLQARIDTGNAQKAAYNSLLTQLDSIKTVGTTLTNPLTFQASTTTSSDENVLTATAGAAAAVGTYQFQVARLVSSQQAVTGGFADPNQSKLTAGTITISEGGGELSAQTALASLNGGNGVSRGVFRITDRGGHSAAIDISSAITLDDVVRQINTSLDVSVKATVTKDGIVLQDLTGQTTGNLIVQDLGDGNAAKDLGIVGNVAANTITGQDINAVGRGTALSQINDGRGIRTASSGDDLQIASSTGTFTVSLGTAKTLGQVIDAINTAGGGKVKADIAPGANGLRLTDTGGGAITVSDLTDSKAAEDLGLAGTANGVMNGTSLIASLNSTLISSLRGGTGIPLGTISLTGRGGATANVDLSGATSVQDILDGINNAGVGIKASLNSSGNGISLSDTTGASGNIVVGEVNSTTAAVLGIKGTFDATVTSVNGANLHHQYVTSNTALTALNGGKGIGTGSFTITGSNGQTATIDTSSGNFITLGDIIKSINARGIGVTASVNANGNGLLLTDTAGGASKLKVVAGNGTTALDLNLLAAGTTTTTATGTTIDGAYEKTVTVDANDTLQSVQTKINGLGFAVTANIINDGSDGTPYRLSLSAKNTGRTGRFVFDAGTTGLDTRNLVEAQDAAVFLGGAGSSQPLLVTSSSNSVANVIKGVTVDLHNVSDKPVTLTVARDGSSISSNLKTFTDGFNIVIDTMTKLTSFDSTTNTKGLLLGEQTADSIQNDLYAMFNGVVKNAGRYKIFADIGVSITDGAKLTFDSTKFDSAYATDPDAVKNLFSQVTTGLGTLITNQINRLTDPVNGVIPRETQTIDSRNQDFQSRIDELTSLLDAKRTRLEQQFANMESVLANLQSQQAALGTLGTLGALSAPKASSSSSAASSSSSSTGSSSSSSGG
jgi:flagellar hook-associated protein 2